MAEKLERSGGKDAPVADEVDAVQELEVFGPEIEELEFGALGKITVRPLKMGQIRKFTQMGKELLPAVFTMAETMKRTGDIDISQLGVIAGEQFFDIVGLAINRKAEELDEMDPDDFARLVAKILVVNMDFFAQKLPKVLEAAAVSVKDAAQANGVGRMLSKS